MTLLQPLQCSHLSEALQCESISTVHQSHVGELMRNAAIVTAQSAHAKGQLQGVSQGRAS